jgi:DNA phosphorothioation-associated putative methyltransferase
MIESQGALAVAAVVESKIAKASNTSVGKQLLTHLYVHKNYVRKLEEDVRILVARALRVAGEFDYDLVKIARDRSHVCLLRYPDFNTAAHPALQYSVKVFLSNGQYCVTDYSTRENPPILHRKETFVGEDYAHYAAFRALTDEEDKHRLLCRPDIGNRKQWLALLASRNLKIKGHTLVQS